MPAFSSIPRFVQLDMSQVTLILEDDDATAFAGKVIEVLNPTLAPNSPTTPSDAAVALDALLVQDYEERGTAGSFLWWFWDLVHDLARQVPYRSPEQDQLVAVIKALDDLPPKEVKLGKDWGDDNSIQVWKGLPMFGNTFYEKVGDADDKAGGETERKERAVNLQTYAAKVSGLCLLPFAMYAVWALVDALEGTMTPIIGAPNEVNEDPASVEDLAYKVKVAAAWMKYAGHLLYGRDEEIHGATAGPLWKFSKADAKKAGRAYRGTNGLSRQRWQLWKERFRAIKDSAEVSEKEKKEAGEACAAMEKIEREQ